MKNSIVLLATILLLCLDTQARRHKEPAFTLSNLSEGDVYLGIGQITDATTGLSRSFGVWEAFNAAGFRISDKPVYAVLVDYPYRPPYCITGSCTADSAHLKLYHNGRKIRDISTAGSLPAILSGLADALNAENIGFEGKRFKDVDEGRRIHLKSKTIAYYLPGSVTTELPGPDTMRAQLAGRYAIEDGDGEGADAYQLAKTQYGRYSNFKEENLFFFRNGDVPTELQVAAKPFVFPVYKWPSATLSYLASGAQLDAIGDWSGGLNATLAALNSSNKLLVSAYDRAVLRKGAFLQIARIYDRQRVDAKYTRELFRFGAQLNGAYCESSGTGSTMRESDEYYEKVGRLKTICTEAESKAKEIRGTRRMGLFTALANTAAGVATTSAYDNTASQAFMDQANVALTASNNEANAASAMLSAQYDDISSKIDGDQFTMGSEADVDHANYIVTKELAFYLALNPDYVKDVLVQYSSDKQRLRSAVEAFYSNTRDENARKELISQMSYIETRVIAAESLKKEISQDLLAKF